MRYTRVYHDDSGETHFETVVNKGNQTEVGLMTAVTHPKAMQFRDSGSANSFSWHNAPQRLYIVMIAGEVEIEVSDGEKRIFGPGDVLLMEDTEGKGHRSASRREQPLDPANIPGQYTYLKHVLRDGLIGKK